MPDDWGLWFDLWAQAFRHPEVKKDRVELDEQWRDLIARVVTAGIDAGEIEKVDVEGFAVMWTALLDGLVDPGRARGPGRRRAPMAKRVALGVARQGARPRPDRSDVRPEQDPQRPRADTRTCDTDGRLRSTSHSGGSPGTLATSAVDPEAAAVEHHVRVRAAEDQVLDPARQDVGAVAGRIPAPPHRPRGRPRPAPDAPSR